jgi:hypothetical protein
MFSPSDNGNKCKNLVDCDRGDNLKFKCDSFCKKFNKKIILDINISDQNIKDQKIQEIFVSIVTIFSFLKIRWYKISAIGSNKLCLT